MVKRTAVSARPQKRAGAPLNRRHVLAEPLEVSISNPLALQANSFA